MKGKERWKAVHEKMEQVGRRLYTVKHAARLLGVSAKVMDEWVEDDVVRLVSIDGKGRILSNDLLRACGAAIQDRLTDLRDHLIK